MFTYSPAEIEESVFNEACSRCGRILSKQGDVSYSLCTVIFLKNGCNHSKIQIKRFYQRIMAPKDVDCIVNGEDPDQTPLGAV